jgi:metallo-beta-lactamase class B
MSVREYFVRAVLVLSLFGTLSSPAAAPNAKSQTPFPAFCIVGNLYYVGSLDLGSYLIATPKGLILINTGFAENTPLIEKSVESLGFHMKDIKILLVGHAHSDHAAGAADIIKMSGAKYYVMDKDVDAVESGGKPDLSYGDEPNQEFTPLHVENVLHDGAKVAFGGMVLTAHLTPGLTKGNTTWTFDEVDHRRVLHVVILGNPGATHAMILVNNPKYPDIVSYYEKGFALMRTLPCDIFLGDHASYGDLTGKYKKLQAGDKDAFIDPAGYKAFIDQMQRAFEAQVAKQKAGSGEGL